MIQLLAPVFPPQLNSFGMTERLAHFLSAEPGELLLEQSEAIRITAEAYRLWAVAAGYGQACKLYTSVNIYSTSWYPDAERSLNKQQMFKKIIKCFHYGSKACAEFYE